MRPAAIGFCSERRYQYTAPRPVMPMKRPAAFTKEGPANKKKPAASTATVSLNEQIAERRESAGKPTPEDESLVKARDKGKGEKWAKLRQEGALPDHITNLYDHPPKGTLSQRAFRTELINKLFARTAEGNLILQTNDAWFVQAKAAYEERYHKKTEDSYTKRIFIGKFFNNDEEKFNAALAEGEILDKDGDDGIKYYSLRKMRTGITQGVKNEHRMESQKKLDKAAYHALVDIFEELKWKYEPSKKDEEKLNDGQIPPSAKKLLAQAQAAQEKLSKQAHALATQLSHEIPIEKLRALKQGHMTAQKHLTTLQHVLSFSELENNTPVTKAGLDALMMQIARDTSDLNQTIETAKGLLKANKN